MLQAYRAYRVSLDGRIESARLLVCASDAEAIVQANQFAAGLDTARDLYPRHQAIALPELYEDHQ